jgi:hypothetical protein
MKRPLARFGPAAIVLALTIPAIASAPLDQYATFNSFDTTIADKQTGLEWQRDDATAASWDDADAYCASLTLRGARWRLPSVKELQTLVDEQLSQRYIDGVGVRPFAIDLEAFPATPSGAFWAWPKSGVSAWIVDFSSGEAKTFGASNAANVRCVRGP